MRRLIRIAWLAIFLTGFAVLAGWQFMWLPPEGEVIGFVRLWLPVSGALIFLLAYFLPREPAVWAAPPLAYLVPAAWFRQSEFVDPAPLLLLIVASALSAWVFRMKLAD